MKLSEKLGYMIVGAVIALAGFGLGSFFTGSDVERKTEAQSEVIEELGVKRLVVRESVTVGSPTKGAVVMIEANSNEGFFRIFGKDGAGAVGLEVADGVGSVEVFSDKMRGVARISSNKGSGEIMVIDKESSGGVMITTNEGNGNVHVTNRFGTFRELD